MPDRTCSDDSCARAVLARGMCSTHYNRSRGRTYKLEQIMCPNCGTEMLRPRRTDRKNQFCSFGCRSVFRRTTGGMGRPRLYGAELVHVGPAPLYCDIPPQHPARQKTVSKPRVFLSGCCEWCSEQFTIVDQLKTRFCSDRCGKNASRARTGRFTIPPQVRSAIYERDAWTCQLCRSPVDPDLPPSDVWAATLDHIECQSWALVPDHSPENLRLAHRWCNSVRGDESHYTAAVLSS